MRSTNRLARRERDPSRRWSRADQWIAAALVALAAALRVPAALGELWLDEVWTAQLAAGLRWPLDVFTLHHSNNHYLYTFWFWVLGTTQGPWILFRVPALVAGAVSPVVAFAVARRFGRVEACATGLLVATSYLLVHYGSEARGYALVVGFSLGCLLFMTRFLEEGRRGRDALGFGICAVLAMLSHLEFLYLWVALAAWSARRLLPPSGSWPEDAFVLLRCHALPALALVALWAVDLRVLAVSDAPPTGLVRSAAETAALALGLPRGDAAAALGAVAVLALSAGALVGMRRAHHDLWIPLALAGLAIPLAAIALVRPAFLHPRYLLVAVASLLIGWGWAFGWAWRARGAGRVLAAIALAVVLAGNALHIQRLWCYGRGTLIEALAFVAQSRPDDASVAVGSLSDSFTQGMLGFFASRGALDPRLRYVTRAGWSADLEWILAYSHGQDPMPPNLRLGPARWRYRLVRTFPYAGLSGANTFVYRAVR